MTGIYRAAPLRTHPRMRTVKAIYKTYVDVIHFRKTDVRRLRGREAEEEEEEGVKKSFTAERVEQLRQLSCSPDIYDRLARALGSRCLSLSLPLSLSSPLSLTSLPLSNELLFNCTILFFFTSTCCTLLYSSENGCYVQSIPHSLIIHVVLHVRMDGYDG